MSYKPLPIVDVGLNALRLDLDNYRIPTRREDEAAALSYLFSAEDVMGSARQILRNGYFDNEVPIATKEGKHYVVLEGNRRVSALKALKDPSIVPEYESELRTLLKRYGNEALDLPDTIRVIVAKDRETAGPHIARLHSGLSKRGWSRDQQANYYYSLLNAHTTVDDVRADHGGVPVARYIKMAVMRRFLSGVNYSDKSLHDYVTGSGLTMSAFEYAFRQKDIAAAIGASFSKQGLLEPVGDKPEKIASALSKQHRAAVEHLMAEFRAERLNTRSPAFKKGTDDHIELIAKLTGLPHAADADEPGDVSDPDEDNEAGSGAGGDAGEDNDDGSDNDDENESTSGSGSGSGGGQGESGARGPNHPDTKDRLQLSGLDYTTHTSVNLQSRYHELRKLSISVHPAATAMLLRSILETSIKYHFESTATSAVGELSPSVAALAAAYGDSKPIKHQIAQIRSGNANTPGSVQWFNLVCHSADMVVSPDQIRKAWALLEPVLRRLLRPATDTSA